MTNITSNQNTGFQLTFENGLTISVQFGRGNYCSNRFKDNDLLKQVADSAEISIWDTDENAFVFNNNDVCLGWLTTDEIATWIDKVKNAKSILVLDKSE